MKPSPLRKYTCSDYREEMRLLGLKRRLTEESLSETERRILAEEVARMEKLMEMG